MSDKYEPDDSYLTDHRHSDVYLRRRRNREQKMRRHKARKEIERHTLRLHEAVILVILVIAFIKGYGGA